MKAPKQKAEKEPPAPPARIGGILDSGELRAIMLGAAGLTVFIYFIKLILLPFILAGIVAYVATPMLDWLAARTRWPRIIFAIGLFVLLVGIAGFVAVVAEVRVMAEVKGIAADFPTMIEHLARQLIGPGPVVVFGQSLSPHDLAQAALARLRDWLGQTSGLVTVAGYGVVAAMGSFLTAVLLIYFLADGRRVARGIFWMVPPHRRPLVARIWTHLDPALLRYFVGVFVIVLYATVAAYVGLGVILGIKHALLLALMTGVLETIPVIGPTAAAVIAGLVSLRSATGIGSILAYAAYATILRLSIDQVVGPIVLGRAAHVHPALIIFCFLAGGVIFGIPGVILAVPVALLVKSTLATLYGEDGR